MVFLAEVTLGHPVVMGLEMTVQDGPGLYAGKKR